MSTRKASRQQAIDEVTEQAVPLRSDAEALHLHPAHRERELVREELLALSQLQAEPVSDAARAQAVARVMAVGQALSTQAQSDEARRAPEQNRSQRVWFARPAYQLAGLGVALASLLLWVYSSSSSQLPVVRNGAKAVAQKEQVHTASEQEPGARQGSQANVSAAGFLVKSGTLRSESSEFTAGQALPDGHWLTAGHGTSVLELADESRLSATEATRLRRRGGADVFELARGRVALEVNKRSSSERLQVQTAELILTVVGTRFSIERSKQAGKQRSQVELQEGRVWVRSKLDGQRHELTPGDSLIIPPLQSEPRGVAARGSARELEPEEASPGNSSGKLAGNSSGKLAGNAAGDQPTPSKIRSTIQQGDVQLARDMIRQARAQQRTSPAELALLEAEADLRDGRTRSALQGYIGVFNDYPNSRQAEVALFAAAQLTRGGRALELTQRYLAHYPNGHFAKQAERLLRSLEGKRHH